MSGEVYAAPMGIIGVGIERWTEAVFGSKFAPRGKALTVGRQADQHSCGVSVINAINSAMHGGRLFTHPDRFMHRLVYFIDAAKYLLEGKVSSTLILHGITRSSFPWARLR